METAIKQILLMVKSVELVRLIFTNVANMFDIRVGDVGPMVT